MKMRLLAFTIVSLFLMPFSVISQKLWNEFYDFYTPEIVLNNKIHEVIVVNKDSVEKQITFNIDGLIETLKVSKNWSTKGQTTKYFYYHRKVLSDQVHIDDITGDTLSYNHYLLQHGMVKSAEGKVLTNFTNTKYYYDEDGKLKESVMVMTYPITHDTSRIDHYFFDEFERKIRLERNSRGNLAVTKYEYSEGYIDIKKLDILTNEYYLDGHLEFNDQLQFIKFTKSNREGNPVVMEILYNDKGLLHEIYLENTRVAYFKYVYGK